MELEYRARDANGKLVIGRFEVQDEHQAIEMLGSKDLLVVQLKKVEARKKPTNGSKSLRLASLAPFTRQLATMLRAGLPLLKCLNGLERQVNDRALQAVLQDLVTAVESGKSLSEAVQRHPRVFSTLYIGMITAGEQSGALPEILDRLAAYLEASLRLRQKIRSAMAYPVIVSLLAIGICIFLITTIIPVFAGIYKDFGATLPLPTLIMIRISTLLRSYLLFCLCGCAATGFLIVRLLRTPTGAGIRDRVKLGFPMLGALAQKIVVSQFSRTFATLMHNGVPILKTLSIVAGSANNVVIEKAVRQMANEIEGGSTMAQAMGRQPIFPPMMQQMAAIGEQTGTVDEMMVHVADHYDREIEATLSGLTSLIEPLLIMFLGIVVGSVVVSMFLPIFRMTDIIKM